MADFLPLKTNANIIEGNALRLNWEEIVPKEKLNYIMGNPPFVGARYMSTVQKDDVLDIFGKNWKNIGNLDYVSCWYKKATDYIQNTKITCAFVSTNSVVQGEMVNGLWKPLFADGIYINFAYHTFVWDSEAMEKAHVHCVIIGFSCCKSSEKAIIYTTNKEGKISKESVKHINGYLIDAEDVFIEKRQKPLCRVPMISLGGQAIDDGNYILTNEEKEELLWKEPQAEEFIRPYMMGKDFINRHPRYCIWLLNANPTQLKKCPNILKRIENVRQFRLSSNRQNTYKAAETPTLFATILELEKNYIALPKVSSQRRRYIPIDYLTPDIIPGDKIFVMPNATIYDFGIITSNVHMAWMRTVAGRLKSDYSYSNTIVYNNFPWPTPTPDQKAEIEKTAQGILDARALFPDSSLADLYDPVTMPPELLKAHQNNDKAVMRAYGFDIKNTSESDCVAKLFKMYEELVKNV